MDCKWLLPTADTAKVRWRVRQPENKKRIQNKLYELEKWTEKREVGREVQNYSDEIPTSQKYEHRMRDKQPLSGTTALDPEIVENHKENVIQ